MYFILNDTHIQFEGTRKIGQCATHHMNHDRVAHNLIAQTHLVRRGDRKPIIDSVLVDAARNTGDGVVPDSINDRPGD